MRTNVNDKYAKATKKKDILQIWKTKTAIEDFYKIARQRKQSSQKKLEDIFAAQKTSTKLGLAYSPGY